LAAAGLLNFKGISGGGRAALRNCALIAQNTLVDNLQARKA
jgi:hypothetical protein